MSVVDLLLCYVTLTTMRVWLGALVTAIVLVAGASPAFADDNGARGDDNGDADRPHQVGPESSAVDYKGASWLAASKENYTNADRPDSDPINKVVVHVMQGTVAGTKAWFRNPDSEVTTHYLVGSNDGEVTQMVHEADIAWHAGNWDYNKTSIGIEHEGWVDDPKKWFTDDMYESSANLVRSICDRYDIPIDRDHIIGHSEVPGADHTDPGKGWDWDRYLDLIRDDSGETTSITLDNDDAGAVSAGDSWSTGEAEGQYGDNFAYASPVLRSDPLWYTADLDEGGRYRIEVRYPAAKHNNTKTPYIVSTTSGNETVYVDQTSRGGSWQSIGTFDLDAGRHRTVAVSRWTGGEGRIIADGVRLFQQ